MEARQYPLTSDTSLAEPNLRAEKQQNSVDCNRAYPTPLISRGAQSGQTFLNPRRQSRAVNRETLSGEGQQCIHISCNRRSGAQTLSARASSLTSLVVHMVSETRHYSLRGRADEDTLVSICCIRDGDEQHGTDTHTSQAIRAEQKMEKDKAISWQHEDLLVKEGQKASSVTTRNHNLLPPPTPNLRPCRSYLLREIRAQTCYPPTAKSFNAVKETR